MAQGADEFVNFMLGFYEKYPEFKTSKLYITGESYAGKYIPIFASHVLHYNKQQVGKFQIPLAAVLIGNPFNAPHLQRNTMHIIAQGLDILDENNMKQIATFERHCDETMATDLIAASDVCGQPLDYIAEVSGNVFSYDARIFGYDWDPYENMVFSFFNKCSKSADLYKAIHIDQSPKTPKFSPSSGAVYQAYIKEEQIDFTNYYSELVQSKLPMIVYTGEFDEHDGPMSQTPWMKNIKSLNEQDPNFWVNARQIYQVPDAANPGSFIIGGYYRSSKIVPFTWLTIPKAGHFVPSTYLDTTKLMLRDYVEKQALQCHKTADGCNLSKIQCAHMDDCNKHGVCSTETGQCTCSDGWTGADCHASIDTLSDKYTKIFKSTGLKWLYFQYKLAMKGKDYVEMNLTSKYPVDFYLKHGYKNEPTKFDYDVLYKDQTDLMISSKYMVSLMQGGFQIAINVKAVDFPANGWYDNQMTVSFKKVSVIEHQEGHQQLSSEYQTVSSFQNI